jgi:hypothetical protein
MGTIHPEGTQGTLWVVENRIGLNGFRRALALPVSLSIPMRDAEAAARGRALEGVSGTTRPTALIVVGQDGSYGKASTCVPGSASTAAS